MQSEIELKAKELVLHFVLRVGLQTNYFLIREYESSDDGWSYNITGSDNDKNNLYSHESNYYNSCSFFDGVD
ncbi:2545_t:CDS:2, partial [Ambispora gerdemannii]